MIYYYCQFSSRRSVDKEERRIVQVGYLKKWWNWVQILSSNQLIFVAMR